MTYEVHIADDFTFDGVSIYVSDKFGPDDRRVLHLSSEYIQEWERIDPAVQNVAPTIRLNGEAARALLEALVRFYEGASDMHQARQDLLHERQRRDKQEDFVQQITLALVHNQPK